MADGPQKRGRVDQVRAYMRRPATVHGYMNSIKKKKKDGAIDSASFEVPLLFSFEYCLDKSQNATSKTLQSLLHSLKTTIDEVLDSGLL